MLPSKTKPSKDTIYHVTFEDYLQPKKPVPHKQRSLQFPPETNKKCKPVMRLRLLEHPVLVAGRPSKWQQIMQKFKATFRRSNSVNSENDFKKDAVTNKPNERILQIGKKWQLKTRLAKKVRPKNTRIERFIKLPGFLSFLRARVDDGLCKRKTGFEIYCEMSSIHGFVNFVGAKTWQRAFWGIVIVIAMFLTTFVLVKWHYLNEDTPTIMYTESTHYPAWTIPFPAVTICNLNRVSREKSEQLAEKFLPHTNLTRQQLLQLFSLPLYGTDLLYKVPKEFQVLQSLLDKNNYTLTKLLSEISPNCGAQLLRCKWKGRIERCEKLFRKIKTPDGHCCAFNYLGWGAQENRSSLQEPQQITSCGYKTGLTVLLDPDVEDYMAALTLTPGFQVLIHDAYAYPAYSIERQLVKARTESDIKVVPETTHATAYMRREGVHIRRCYLPDERQLVNFSNYTQSNCLAECRSKLFEQKCGCVPLFRSNINGTTACSLSQAACIMKNRAIFHSLLKHERPLYKIDRYAEQFICDCYPKCSFNKYTSSIDTATLNTTFALGHKRFFKGIDFKDHILLHVYYGDLIAVKYRLDVFENWLSFVGTFGGIAGLQMGYSFVSGFEMIFFTFVRPLCNWLTKTQIRYRIKRRKKKAAAELAKKALEQEKQREIEATTQVSANEKV